MHAIADRPGAESGAFAVVPLSDALGAEIVGVDLSRPLERSHLVRIAEAWSRHLVLRFRGQQAMSADDLIGFSSLFGPLDHRPIATGKRATAIPDDRPELTLISNVLVDGKPIGGLGAYEASWHADMTYNERPPKGSCLLAREVPPCGGDTWFSNMYRAYETLPDSLRTRIHGLSCVHDASRNSAGELRVGYADESDPRKTVGAVHPLVRTHPVTGRKCLFLGRRRAAYIPGLSLEDSEALLDELWTHATDSRFAWVQQWKVGDLVMWDNRCTMHRRDSFDPATRRLLYRTQIAGEPLS